MKKEKNIKRGKKSRKSGSRFELKVREDLESKGWICAKWTNNVEFVKETIVQISKGIEEAIVLANVAYEQFPRQRKYFERLKASAKHSLGDLDK